MTKLEYINKLIRDNKSSKERFLYHLKKYPDDEVFLKCVKTCEERIDILQQIKTDLKAWESIKPYLVVEEGYIAFYEGSYKILSLKNGSIDEIESEEDCLNLNTILKALEVK